MTQTQLYQITINGDVILLKSGPTRQMEQEARDLNNKADSRYAYGAYSGRETAQSVATWIATGQWN